MTAQKFLNNRSIDVFSFERPDNLDIMLDVKGLSFNEYFDLSYMYETDIIKIHLINYNHLIEAKKASGRPKSLVDIMYLEKEEEEEEEEECKNDLINLHILKKLSIYE